MKRVWAKKGTTPRSRVTGSKHKTCVYGALAQDGRQLFRQYPRCNSGHLITYLSHLMRKFGRLVLILDRAPWHRSKRTDRYLKDHARTIRVLWLPTGFPELNPIEECWRQGKYDDDLGAKFHSTSTAFHYAVSAYYRTKRFHINLSKYLCQ